MEKIIKVILVLILIGVIAYFIFDLIKEKSPEKNIKEDVNLEESTDESMVVRVFFSNTKKDPHSYYCGKVYPTERIIPKTEAVARAALEELLKGPNASEQRQGFFTAVNPGVKVQSLVIENKTAKVDFNKQLEFQVSGSCRIMSIKAQIEKTLQQFSTIDKVIISINGKTEDILQS